MSDAPDADPEPEDQGDKADDAAFDTRIGVEARRVEIAEFRALHATAYEFTPAVNAAVTERESLADQSGFDHDVISARNLSLVLIWRAMGAIAHRWTTHDPLGGTMKAPGARP